MAKAAVTLVQPLPHAGHEAVVQRAINNVLAKPGFINTPATRDVLARAMRRCVLDTHDPTEEALRDLLRAAEGMLSTLGQVGGLGGVDPVSRQPLLPPWQAAIERAKKTLGATHDQT